MTVDVDGVSVRVGKVLSPVEMVVPADRESQGPDASEDLEGLMEFGFGRVGDYEGAIDGPDEPAPLRRESGGMLDPCEALFIHGGRVCVKGALPDPEAAAALTTCPPRLRPFGNSLPALRRRSPFSGPWPRC